MSHFRQKNEPSSKLLKHKPLDWIRYPCYKSLFFSSFFFKLFTFCFPPPDFQIPTHLFERVELKYSPKAAVPSTFQIKKNPKISINLVPYSRHVHSLKFLLQYLFLSSWDLQALT